MNQISLPIYVQKALDILQSAGYEAYIVGGCVRDILMGKTPHDYDITTSALPDEIEACFINYRIVKTGIKHGTVTVLMEATDFNSKAESDVAEIANKTVPVEITTFRVDGPYTDHRRPDTVYFTKKLEEDLSRRDFTVNAMAYNPKKGLVDCFGGTYDLSEGILRCVGDSQKRFEEDALRILRALRFSSVLGFAIEKNTRSAVFEKKELLGSVSGERISSELSRLVCGSFVRPVLTEYIDVLAVPIPELAAMKSLDQKNPHHIYDVLTHTAVAVENTPPQPIMRLAALFHDIGKPLCFTSDENGMGHFYWHGEIGAEMTENILRRLKFSNDITNAVSQLVLEHGRQIEENPKAVKRALNRLGSETFFMLLDLKRADCLAMNPAYFHILDHYEEIKRMALEILAKKECFTLKDLAVNGNDLVEAGIPRGKKTGAALKLLLDAVMDGDVANQKDCLITYIKNRF